MGNVNKRLDDLENRTGSDDKINIYVSWRDDDLVKDKCHGDELLTVEAWEKRHPKDRLIIVTYEDLGDDELDPLPVG